MGPLGWQETVFIFVLALLVFGPKKLPELGKNIGKAMSEFRRHSSELRSTWDRQMVELERETAPIKEAAQSYSNEISSAAYDAGQYEDPDYYNDPDHLANSNQEISTVDASATEGVEQSPNVEEVALLEAAPEGPAEESGQAEAGQKPEHS
jgi:sec-independent protein translocase protein TatA